MARSPTRRRGSATDAAAGRIVVLATPPGQRAYLPFATLTQHPRFARAVAVAAGELNLVDPGLIAATKAGAARPCVGRRRRARCRCCFRPRPWKRSLGGPIAQLSRGALGPPLGGQRRDQGGARPLRRPATWWPSSRGSDPRLRGEYVALGAHNDHLGLASRRRSITTRSARINRVDCIPAVPTRPSAPATAAEVGRHSGGDDSLHRLHPPRRIRSITGPTTTARAPWPCSRSPRPPRARPSAPPVAALRVAHGEEEGVLRIELLHRAPVGAAGLDRGAAQHGHDRPGRCGRFAGRRVRPTCR